MSKIFINFAHYNLMMNMEYDGGFVLQKTVDWSLLNDHSCVCMLAVCLFSFTQETKY